MDSSGNIRNIETDMPKEQWEDFAGNFRDRGSMMDDFRDATIIKKNEIPLKESEAKELKAMSKPRRKNWMRNQPCVCGSGKKMKKCCWSKLAHTAKTE